MTLHQVTDRVTSCASTGAASLVVSNTAHIQRGKNHSLAVTGNCENTATRSMPESEEFSRERFIT